MLRQRGLGAAAPADRGRQRHDAAGDLARPGPCIGPEASIREYQRLFQMFRGIEVSVGNIVSHDSWVIAHYRGVMEVEVPDFPKQLEFTGVHRFEDGLFAESHYRLDRDAALAAAGL